MELKAAKSNCKSATLGRIGIENLFALGTAR